MNLYSNDKKWEYRATVKRKGGNSGSKASEKIKWDGTLTIYPWNMNLLVTRRGNSVDFSRDYRRTTATKSFYASCCITSHHCKQIQGYKLEQGPCQERNWCGGHNMELPEGKERCWGRGGQHKGKPEPENKGLWRERQKEECDEASELNVGEGTGSRMNLSWEEPAASEPERGATLWKGKEKSGDIKTGRYMDLYAYSFYSEKKSILIMNTWRT